MKIPFVKEWGSWAVFGTSCVIALILGSRTDPWGRGLHYSQLATFTILGLFLLINAKNPLASLIRTRGKKKEHVIWFLLFVIPGLVFLLPVLSTGIRSFAFSLFLVAIYAALLWRGREHHIITELNGFALLTLSAPIVYYAVSGQISYRLYVAVFMFFAAGVLKVRMRLKKNLFFRLVMLLYCAVVPIAFYLMKINVITLLPLVENSMSALWLREEKLRATGYIELLKSVVFVILISIYWKNL